MKMTRKHTRGSRVTASMQGEKNELQPCPRTKSKMTVKPDGFVVDYVWRVDDKAAGYTPRACMHNKAAAINFHSLNNYGNTSPGGGATEKTSSRATP